TVMREWVSESRSSEGYAFHAKGLGSPRCRNPAARVGGRHGWKLLFSTAGRRASLFSGDRVLGGRRVCPFLGEQRWLDGVRLPGFPDVLPGGPASPVFRARHLRAP